MPFWNRSDDPEKGYSHKRDRLEGCEDSKYELSPHTGHLSKSSCEIYAHVPARLLDRMWESIEHLPPSQSTAEAGELELRATVKENVCLMELCDKGYTLVEARKTHRGFWEMWEYETVRQEIPGSPEPDESIEPVSALSTRDLEPAEPDFDEILEDVNCIFSTW